MGIKKCYIFVLTNDGHGSMNVTKGKIFRNNLNGAVVQLVRISACHAGGRGFESRPHRRRERRMSKAYSLVQLLYSFFFVFGILSYIRSDYGECHRTGMCGIGKSVVVAGMNDEISGLLISRIVKVYFMVS